MSAKVNFPRKIKSNEQKKVIFPRKSEEQKKGQMARKKTKNDEARKK